MAKTLAQMSAETRAVTIEKGWRATDGGPGDRTWGDYVALLHTEIAEATEASRDQGLNDATATLDWVNGDDDPEDGPTSADFPLPKPEGVGSEMADVLIRLLDMCDAFDVEPFDMDVKLADVRPINLSLLDPYPVTFGDHAAWLHNHAASLWFWGVPARSRTASAVLRVLVAVCENFGIDLDAEYERKVAYNRTRSFRHGGRSL